MEKFDLKRALAGEPVVTRSGDRVLRIVGMFPEIKSDHQLLVIDATGFLRDYSGEGRFYRDGSESSLDLFMA